MQINKKIRSGNKEVDLYIESLENFATELDANNVYKMLKAIDENAGVIADDIVKLATVADDDKLESELKLLGSKRNKRFEAFLALVKTAKDFGTVGAMIKEMRATIPVKTSETKEEEVVPTKKKSNIQDFVLNRAV